MVKLLFNLYLIFYAQKLQQWIRSKCNMNSTEDRIQIPHIGGGITHFFIKFILNTKIFKSF